MKFIIFVSVVLLVVALSNHFRWRYDDTDDYRPGQMFGKRSGMAIYTDHLTGVQYIGYSENTVE